MSFNLEIFWFNLLVFLIGSDAALPDVGTCTFMEYFCNARKCSTAFYKALQKDSKANCVYVDSKMLVL